MTKYKLLKPIKNVDWKVGEVKETEQDWNGFDDIITRSCRIRHFELLLLEHAGFIEEVNDVRIIPVGVGDVAVCCGGETLRTFQPLETPKRWRAKKYSNYFYLNENFEVTEKSDIWGAYDNARYKAGNYFQTTEQAEEFRKGVKALIA